jgi:hypothetical protein
MNDIIFRCIGNINIEDDIECTENIEIEIGDIRETEETQETEETEEVNEEMPLNTANDLGWEVREAARDAGVSAGMMRCICRYNNFNLCDRNTVDNLLYCRYHKNTKIGYIHKIFYDVFKEKKEIAAGDLYVLYRHVDSNFGYIKELYIDLLKNIPFKILLNIAKKNHIISNERKYSKNEIYLRLYNINKNTCDLESNKANIEAFRKIHKIQQRLKYRLCDRIKNKIRDRLRNNIFKLENALPNTLLLLLKSPSKVSLIKLSGKVFSKIC